MKISYSILFVLLAVGGAWWYQNSKNEVVNTTTSSIEWTRHNASFSYPSSLTLAGNQESGYTLSHSIPFEHTDFCDLRGEDLVLEPNLTDFHLRLNIYEMSLADTVTMLRPYIAKDYLVHGELVITEGYIDRVQVGTYAGYSHTEGVEGCGQVTYYIPINTHKTLVLVNRTIAELSGAITPEIRTKILAIPGVITPENNERIFEEIVGSITVE